MAVPDKREGSAKLTRAIRGFLVHTARLGGSGAQTLPRQRRINKNQRSVAGPFSCIRAGPRLMFNGLLFRPNTLSHNRFPSLCCDIFLG